MIRLVATTALLAVAVSACGTTEVEPAAVSSAAPASQSCADDTTTTSTAPVSLTDGVGRTVELAKPASRVAVLEWQQTEDVLTLCLNPVAVADAKGYGTYVKAEALPAGVADTGERGEPDLDALYATNPDLIIVEAFKADDELITKLEKRGVPVLATVGADASGQIANMKKVFSMIGTATGRTERADLVLKQFDEHLAEAKQKVAAANVTATDFLFFDGWIEGGNVVIRPYGKGALFTELGEQLGLTPAWTDEINQAYGSGGVDPAYGLAQTDIEGLTAVGSASLFYSDDATPDSYVKELTKSSIWTKLPAVTEGRAYPFPAGVWGAGGPKSNEEAIDAYVNILTGK
ncbi:iron-siderophore ABC transporter substrate-binding protein [Actinoplanes derwentensis]|uniref:Iron complex transport system substrate-binding protein n=1 Tax=Actinoplanes derwentensis TaxID=113562 RepID=A0A1H1Y2H7_9ACTN|nr:iron-siderophore ABC transporter substrate-binding protein [Actinoplanes derwentensis]GID86747.1 ABC transporter substrate-binding protein [Actinoplanes derwentensis]SDT15630.1 iron complex transport system substrate-binding protein [Actinoplanes derwentensis]